MRDIKVASLKRILTGAAASVIASVTAGGALADYQTGLTAYQNGQYDLAVDIWERFAVAGDVRSKKMLGDVYSENNENGVKADMSKDNIQVDNIEALKWYTLAANHGFTFKKPSTAEVNARILAEQRLPKIRARMSTAHVTKAEKLVAQTFERGSPYDIFRLGKMYQEGSGVKKNNARALQMYALAKARGVGEASAAYENLEPLMTSKEIKTAIERTAEWQPPLPIEHTGQTNQQKELARLKKELEELKLEDALKAVSDVDVELIQRAMRSLGFYHGAIDNKMGQQIPDRVGRRNSTMFGFIIPCKYS